jgi:hypothetical protein
MSDLVAAGDWLTVIQLPPCARQLNPAELVLSHLKGSLACLASARLDRAPFCNPHAIDDR